MDISIHDAREEVWEIVNGGNDGVNIQGVNDAWGNLTEETFQDLRSKWGRILINRPWLRR